MAAARETNKTHCLVSGAIFKDYVTLLRNPSKKRRPGCVLLRGSFRRKKKPGQIVVWSLEGRLGTCIWYGMHGTKARSLNKKAHDPREAKGYLF